MPPPMAFRRLSLGAALVLSAAGCSLAQPEWMAVGRRGMVASDSPHASRIGAEILEAGGNAVDAATAVSFALAVTRPYSTGLGGGGFLIHRSGETGEVHVFDFRETAPAAATTDMYERALKSGRFGPRPSRIGHLAVGVPGVVAGRVQVLERFGTRSLAELIEPAIRLARDGFEVDAHYADTCADVLETYRRQPDLENTCGYVWQTHLREGDLRQPGDTLVQPALARLLEAIAREGADAFYRGPVAEALVETVQRHGGIITADDLTSYRVVERRPILATYRDYELILMPLPSSGGVCLAETLNILETFDLPAMARRDRSLAMHYIVEAMKHAFSDRARWMGDADFVPVPVEFLTSKSYGSSLARSLSGDATDPSPRRYGATTLPDDSGTSHFCVVDRFGNVVVSTETINTSFGSLAAIDEWGLILNNEMDDFSAHRGEVNAFGLQQSQRNRIEPNKRPLSSMSPTIVLKNGEPFLLLGGSGGPRIISSVLAVFLGVTDLRMSLREAMTAVRLHHQWQPNEVVFDQNPPPWLEKSLRARGHTLSDRRKTGIVQAIRVEGSQLRGASDPRKGGKPSGY